ncbi:MAG: sugar ABC transporter ATP-binding protein [Clostridiales bacterium]|nr:sugar ABC transporter ATP-binding protein [Clostridiales bacterium]MDY2835410.1 sugar ABC transporter ATP-binding protein [Candidatus Aphodomonas sp.]
MESNENRKVILKATHIMKTFSQVAALKNVDFELRAGEVMALMGENGAGKSTLVKIITGLYSRDSGTIELDGEEISPRNVLESQRLGIQTVYQELNLSPFLSVAENLFLGHEIKDSRGQIDWKKTNAEARRIMNEMQIDIDVTAPLKNLTAALQQMVAIARAVTVNAKVLILDEPSSSLDADEVAVLFREVRRLKAKGLGIIYITHRMNEVFEISDRITILRNGELVGVYNAEDLDMASLVTNMIGNAVDRATVARKADNPAIKDAPVLYSVRNVSKKNRLYGVNLDIRRGEIVGLAGLLGSGRTELAKIIFGDDQDFTGELYMDGKEIRLKNPKMAIKNGVAYCTEERRSEGIFGLMSIADNIVMPSIDNYTKAGVIDDRKKNRTVDSFIRRLAVKTPSARTEIRKLSGGNQQKALVARWLCMDTRFIIFDEPTRGIDVGAKSEIEKLVQELANEGLSVLYISSEFEELVRGCDRVVVLFEGHVVGELTGEDISVDNILDRIAEGGNRVHAEMKAEEARVHASSEATKN